MASETDNVGIAHADEIHKYDTSTDQWQHIMNWGSLEMTGNIMIADSNNNQIIFKHEYSPHLIIFNGDNKTLTTLENKTRGNILNQEPRVETKLTKQRQLQLWAMKFILLEIWMHLI